MNIIRSFYKMAILIIAGIVLSCAQLPESPAPPIADTFFRLRVAIDNNVIGTIDEDGNIKIKKDLEIDDAKEAIKNLMLECVRLNENLQQLRAKFPDPAIPMVQFDDAPREI